jgi:AraC family transcriptional regulator, transcriptional activator of the genes for pyochelin and ferripyochelin receptors
LQELMGAAALPSSLQRVVSNELAYGIESQPMTPELFRLLDEILYCDASGASRQLYLEGKGLELLALLIDRLEETERASSSRLSQTVIDRLQVARQILLARLETPPSLPELARRAGLNEAKLKAGFRVLFGASVFAYLRRERMEEARRLLRARNYNVTEVAARVGYSNPSKFAAAFRKQFGMSPSAGARS